MRIGVSRELWSQRVGHEHGTIVICDTGKPLRAPRRRKASAFQFTFKGFASKDLASGRRDQAFMTDASLQAPRSQLASWPSPSHRGGLCPNFVSTRYHLQHLYSCIATLASAQVAARSARRYSSNRA